MRRKKFVIILLTAVFLAIPAGTFKSDADNEEKIQITKEQEIMTLEEYLEKSGEEWFLTGKLEYTVQAMMVSGEMSFHNDLEAADYTVKDDGITVVLKGTIGEMWAVKLANVISTYTMPDGSRIRKKDFAEKDVFIDIISIPAADTNFAMHVPKDICVTVETSWGSVLHTNLSDASHGDGDFLVCRADENGKPDLKDVWIVNGALFEKTYDTGNMNKD